MPDCYGRDGVKMSGYFSSGFLLLPRSLGNCAVLENVGVNIKKCITSFFCRAPESGPPVLIEK
jgi:hypothetical protein